MTSVVGSNRMFLCVVGKNSPQYVGAVPSVNLVRAEARRLEASMSLLLSARVLQKCPIYTRLVIV